MNLDQCRLAATQIDAIYLAPICESVKRCQNGMTMGHLRWMVEQINSPDFVQDKAMRWLGYVQGVLVAAYGVGLDDMKDISRRAVG